MKLLKTSLFTSVSQALTILSGLITVKVVSSHLGPQGMAYIGQFSNTTTIFSLFATGAITSGVVKYIAEFHNDKEKQFKIIQTAFWITAICTFLVAAIIITFSLQLSVKAFKTYDYRNIYILWALLLIFNTISGLLGAVVNALKKIRLLTVLNITSTLLGLVIVILMAQFYGVKGVLLAQSFVSIFLFLLHLFFLNKYKWFSFSQLFTFKIDKNIVKMLFAFFLMSAISGLLTPSLQFYIRDNIISSLGLKNAGYWQAVTRISDYYLGFITGVLIVYYLPRLSEINDKKELRKEILYGYKMILPAVAIMSFIIWLLRFFIIKILMTPDFLPSAQLFGIQFLGDFFKIGSWLLAFLMMAKAMKYTFIISEIIFNITYGLITVYLIQKVGLMGSVYGFAINYFLYWISMFFIMKYHKII